MTHDQAGVRDFAQSYTEAWCSHDPARVADHYTPGGTIAINGGEPTEITEVAHSFIATFPDIQVFMDDVVFKDKVVELHWTFTGTNTGPGRTGSSSKGRRSCRPRVVSWCRNSRDIPNLAHQARWSPELSELKGRCPL